MQFRGYIFLPRNSRCERLGLRAYIAKIWLKSKIFQLFRNFTKIGIYTKNDEMNMVSLVSFSSKCQNGGDPHFCKNPKKWGFHKNDEFSLSRNFSRRNVYLAKSISLEDANSEKWSRESKNSLHGSLSKMVKKWPKMAIFLPLTPFFQKQVNIRLWTDIFHKDN